MGGRITQKKFSLFHNRKGLKGGRQEKKGQDSEMQGTGCGRHRPPGGGGGGGRPPPPPPPPPPHYFSDLDVLFVCMIFWDKYRNFTYVTLKRFL